MAKLIYAALTSLDGFVADKSGSFDWAAPDAEVHTFVNDLTRPIGTHLYGRRMYEVLVAWESDDILIDQPPEIHDFAAIWRAADIFLNPIIIGAGNPALPDDVRVPLELLDERRFAGGVVYLRYQTGPKATDS